jgi:putative acetyltransferase
MRTARGYRRRVEVVVRPERDEDHAAIAAVVRGAFARHPDEVALLVERIRASDGYVPDLALVAEDESGIVGHVMLSWYAVEGGVRPRLLVLSPLAVRPDRQRQGIGTRLTQAALAGAEAMGEPAVLLEGIPQYYPRFGFERASALGFAPPGPNVPDDAFMVKRLAGFEPALAGRLLYPPAFDHM